MGRALEIQTPEVFAPILEPGRYKGLWGGRGSAKSHTFAEMAIEDCMRHPGMRFACIREVQKSLEQSVKRLLEDKIEAFGVGYAFRVLDTHIETPGEGIIIFQGMQNHTADSIKSLEGFHRGWVEEAQSLSQRSLDLLRPTFFRVPNCELWFSWNPRNATDPVDKMLRGKVPPPDSVVIGSTYRDNPFFPPDLRKEMEWDRQTDTEKYAHIWLGGYERHSQARVFKNWRVEEFDTPPGTHFYTGGDWGFSVDPSTLVRCFVQTHDPATNKPWPRRRLYIDRECYRIGVEIDDLPRFFDGLVCGCDYAQPGQPCRDKDRHGMMRQWPIVADSARPETISYLRRHGYPLMEAAKKGANSVKEGVMFLQSFEIIIHPRCVHTVDEYTMYSFVVDKLTDKVTNVLEDKKNHIIDPTRYAVEALRNAVRVRETEWA